MLKRSLLSFSFIFIFFFGAITHASELAFSRNARTFESQHSSLLIKSLAHSCLALEEVPDFLPCNPAMTPKHSKANLKAEGLISNGYSNLAKTRRLLKGDVDQTLIDELFSEDRVLQVEAQADVMFTSNLISSRYSPLSYKFFSVVRNDANPDVEVFAVEEQDLSIQTGYSWGNLDVGVEFKKTDWKFIRQRTKLLALATPQGLEAMKPKDQSGLFVQPAVNYNFRTAWSPRLAAQVVNLGTLSEEYDEFQHPIEVQVGAGLTPPMPFGRLDLLVDYKSLNYEESEDEKLHFGMLYKYGAMNLGFGIDSNGISTGVFYGLEQINAGILFSTTRMPWKQEDYFAQTVYVQMGWQL